MTRLPPTAIRTARSIYEAYERDAKDWRRPHLGASLIGDSCNRKLWYTFRWAKNPGFDGRMLRLFDRGHRDEEWLASDLRKIGCTVHTVDPVTGKQFRLAHFIKHFGGHFDGSIDGAVLGVPEASATWHLFEAKTANGKRFRQLLKVGVQKWSPTYWAQLHVYMHVLGLDRALFMCVNKDDDDIYTERVKVDHEEAKRQIEKAGLVIFAAEPLSRISENPSWFECEFCTHVEHCQRFDIGGLERNCRTCSFATPEPDGSWTCSLHRATLDIDAQRRGCEKHLFIPSMLPWEAIDYQEDPPAVTYRKTDGTVLIDSMRVLQPVEGQ